MRKALKELRRMKFTQEEAASKLNCTSQHISHIENGVSGCKLKFAYEFSELLGYDIDPTGQISKAFDRVEQLNITQAKQLAKKLNVPFDPEELFVEVE